jgi:hypothetical protein
MPSVVSWEFNRFCKDGNPSSLSSSIPMILALITGFLFQRLDFCFSPKKIKQESGDYEEEKSSHTFYSAVNFGDNRVVISR